MNYLTEPICGNCKQNVKGKCVLSGKPVNVLLAACEFHPAIITPEHSALLDREYGRRAAKQEAERQRKAELKKQAKEASTWKRTDTQTPKTNTCVNSLENR